MRLRTRGHRKVVTGDCQRGVGWSLGTVLGLAGVSTGKVGLLLLRRITTTSLFRRHRSHVAGLGRASSTTTTPARAGVRISGHVRVVGRALISGVCVRGLLRGSATTSPSRFVAVAGRHSGARVAVLRRHDQTSTGHCPDHDNAQKEKVDGALSHGFSPLFDFTTEDTESQRKVIIGFPFFASQSLWLRVSVASFGLLR